MVYSKRAGISPKIQRPTMPLRFFIDHKPMLSSQLMERANEV